MKTIDQLVEAQAARTPDSLAVQSSGGAVTYAQLDRQVGALAARLQAAGAGPGCTVGLYMPRSWRLPAGLLAVLRTGAAYLPLDPLYPASRIEFMLRDAGVDIILTEGSYASAAAGFGCVGVPAEEAAGSAAPAVQSRSSLDQLAYVIYTSGSTGTPKGVEIGHRALATFTAAILERPGVSAADRLLAVTTVCFDIAVLELLVPLAVGATIVVAQEDAVRDGRMVQVLLDREEITVLQATPSLWRMLLDSGASLRPGLRMFCGGEALTRPLADRLLQQGGELWNLYGPTEATVWCSAHRVGRHEEQVPIGTPLAGYDLRILDDALAAVPEGQEGEICIAGPALARGYRNRRELTASRFVVTRGGARIYRTGDIGRRRGDGVFECLGRIDEQLKIDGFRVEPREVEGILERHAAIARAVVALRPSGEGQRLVAYLLPRERTLPSPSELRAVLRGVVPPYMIPSAFAPLDRLPLTASGKVDRKQLAACSGPFLEESGARGAKGSFVEERLRLMWRELLELTEVGLHDDFFALGGRSLTAAALFVRIEADFGVHLPIATLLQAPTVAALAAEVERGAASMAWEPLVPLQDRGTGPPLFLVHPLGGNVITYRPLVAHLGTARPVWGLQARGLDGRQPPHEQIEAMASDYVEQVLRVSGTAACVLAGASFGGLVAYEMGAQMSARYAIRPHVLLFDTECPDAAWWAAPAYRRSRLFREKIYPLLQRVRSHLRALRQHGARRHLDAIVSRPGPSGEAAVDDPRDRGGTLPGPVSRVSRANERAARMYLPAGYAGDVTLFRASDPRVAPDARNGWRRVAPRLRETAVPGNHRSMRVEHAGELAGAILAALERRRPAETAAPDARAVAT